MTVWTDSRFSAAFAPSSRYSDSGVVTRMSPGSRAWARRSACGVSPVRMCTTGSRAASPRRAAVRVMPVSGARRLRSMSVASAFSGEMYSTE